MLATQAQSDTGRGNWMTIIGIVGNTKEFGLSEDTADGSYFAMDQDTRIGSLLVRTSGDPNGIWRIRCAMPSVNSIRRRRLLT